MKDTLKNILPHFLAILSFLLVTVIYFLPQTQGDEIKSSDITHFEAMAHEVKSYEAKTGEVALWTNSMFGGMPAYQITGPQKKNLIKPLRNLQQLFIARPIGYFIGGMIGFYILMLVLGVSPLLGAFGALLFALSTNNLVLFEAGHMSKLAAVFSMPLYLAGFLLTFKKKYLFGGTLFSVGLALNILHNHLQMTYLLGILSMILMVFYFVKYLREKELKHFITVSVIFLIGAILAIATSSSKILTTYEYSKDTMRGKPVLTSTNPNPASSSETKGLEWNYAMQWSNGWSDLLSSFIAGAVGGGSAEPVGDNSAFAKKYKQLAGRAPAELKAPLYWGQLPGTSGPIYFGAIMCFLFLFGAMIVKGPLKWWIVTGVTLTLLLSLGKNFEVFNHFMFDYFPYFNKFRAPNSILSLTVFLIPLLGILGIREVIKHKEKEELLKKLYIAGGILGGISLILLVFGSSMFDFTTAGDDRYQQMDLLDAIISDRKDLLFFDSLKTFFYIAISVGLIWLYLKKKMQAVYMIIGLGVLSMFDLVSVDLRYLNHDDFTSKGRLSTDFKQRPVDREILKDQDLSYRVLDVSINTFNSSMSSYFHKTIGGYHAAKLQRYQDLIDRHISQGNQNVLDMLNTKYFIQGQPGQEQFSVNQDALGNAWFVEDILKVSTANQEVDALSEFNPSKIAIVNQEFDSYMDKFDSDGKGMIQLSSYSPDRMTYNTSASQEQFAVFSEIWYGPDKGWKAYVDGIESDFIRVNYALRGMRIPSGTHEVVFEFKPTSYYVGENISLVSSGLLLLLLIFVGGREILPFIRKG